MLTFSRDFLRGEGDLTKHLSYLGFVVSHEQKYLDEFDYSVGNLSIDLRCGIRLMYDLPFLIRFMANTSQTNLFFIIPFYFCRKVTSLLLKTWTLMHEARVPAISKLQKIHNIGVAMKALEDSSMAIRGGITSKDICEGHREKTLNLLWQLIFKFQVENLIFKKVSYLRNDFYKGRRKT